jgi:hypothetical protein
MEIGTSPVRGGTDSSLGGDLSVITVASRAASE